MIIIIMLKRIAQLGVKPNSDNEQRIYFEDFIQYPEDCVLDKNES